MNQDPIKNSVMLLIQKLQFVYIHIGEIRVIEFWIKLSYLIHSDKAINGLSDILIIFWFRDIHDRIVYKEFSIRVGL